MTEPGAPRVAVYLDFDNIVISRYDQVHGRGQFQRDKARGFDQSDKAPDPEVMDKLRRATVDVGAVIDFASSFGTLVLTRAYADWSAPVNAGYRGQLVSRAVDLVVAGDHDVVEVDVDGDTRHPWAWVTHEAILSRDRPAGIENPGAMAGRVAGSRRLARLATGWRPGPAVHFWAHFGSCQQLPTSLG